jgi:hypothetical protein
MRLVGLGAVIGVLVFAAALGAAPAAAAVVDVVMFAAAVTRSAGICGCGGGTGLPEND